MKSQHVHKKDPEILKFSNIMSKKMAAFIMKTLCDLLRIIAETIP